MLLWDVLFTRVTRCQSQGGHHGIIEQLEVEGSRRISLFQSLPPCAETPPTEPGCSRPCPVWGVEHLQGWATCASASPHFTLTTKGFFLICNLNLPSFNLNWSELSPYEGNAHRPGKSEPSVWVSGSCAHHVLLTGLHWSSWAAVDAASLDLWGIFFAVLPITQRQMFTSYRSAVWRHISKYILFILLPGLNILKQENSWPRFQQLSEKVGLLDNPH